jgi:hypothetical protein
MRLNSRLRKIWREILVPENYLLVGRALVVAWRVRQVLPESEVTPHLGPAIRAIGLLKVEPRGGWTISNPRKILLIADLLVRLPFRWGLCVQRSLIAWRLLNGYGIPASVCYGVPIGSDAAREGHAWIRLWREADRHAIDEPEPLDRFQIVFISPAPIAPE